MRRPFLALLLGFLLPSWAQADEGQWLPRQLSSLDAERLKRMGMEIPVERLNGPRGLLRAAVNYSGCSAGFVSAEGLVATNHHCAYPAIQALATPENDVLREGFLARTRAEERPAKGRGEIDVLVEETDVTELVAEAAGAAQNDAERVARVQARHNELASACEEAHPGHRCEAFADFFGHRHRMVRTLHIQDVRLVYAPPSGVGEFGGEIDNWQWPRHSGDFSLLRAYVGPDGKPAPYAEDNVPYRPEVHFEVATDGVAEGDFVMTTGYPGRTDRYWPSVEVQRYVDQVFPAVVSLYGDWVELLERRGATSKALGLKVAASKKGLANRLKNAKGMLAGLERMRLVDRKAAFERSLGAQAEPILKEAAELTQKARQGFQRAFLLENLSRGPNLLAVAVDNARVALEAQKAPADRDPRYADRNLGLIWKNQGRRLRDYAQAVEAPWLADTLVRLKAQKLLPPFLGNAPLGSAARARPVAAKMLSRSKLNREAYARRFFEAKDPSAIRASGDGLARLGLFLAQKTLEAEAERKAIEGGWMRVGPSFLSFVQQRSKSPMYPDANGSLRVSVAQVRGYIVKDGLQAIPMTTLAGQLLKHQGEAPFDLPPRFRAAAERRLRSRWVEKELGDVPVCFLSTADTTGGNSGSPVLDGQGRLVGLNFDRVWENIAGDFAYNIAWSRNISLDVRYLLWTLQEVEKADQLLAEMNVGVTTR
ncbi:MAG: S46 family peptidase [Myxococcota bacterium]